MNCSIHLMLPSTIRKTAGVKDREGLVRRFRNHRFQIQWEQIRLHIMEFRGF